jgi:hypothetical protein
LETTKCELEEKKREMTEIIGENLHLTNENSGLWRKIEAKDRVIAYKRAKLEKLQNSLEEKKLHKVHEELASNQRVLVSKNKAITKLQEQNRESQVELEQLRTCLNEQQLDTRELAVATRELESKNTTISELETENLRLAVNDSQLRRNIEDRDRIIASSAIEKNLIHSSLPIPIQFTPINRTLFEPTKFHGDLLGLHHNSNTAEFVRPAVKAKDVLIYKATKEVGMRYVTDDKNSNELYPLSLLQEVRLNQKSQIKLLNQPRFLELFHSEKPDLAVEDLETDDQFSHILKPEDSQVLQHYPEKSDLMLENKDNQHQHLLEEDAHPMPQNRRKSDCVKKGDNQPRHIPDNQHITLPPNPEKSDLLEKKDDQLKPEDPPNPEKSDFKEKKDNQTQVKPKDPQELDHNEEKYDLLEKKFNNKLLELNNQMLELNNKINFLLEQKDPHSLPQNPTEKSDLLEKENNQLKHKLEDPQVLGNPKVEQVPETLKKQSFGQNIKKSLISVKELFQPRKQTELENNPAEKNEPDVEKCVINGKTFPLFFDDVFVKSVVDYNVWESIGKPKIINKEKWGKFEFDDGISLIGETKVNIEVNGKKKKIKILVVNKPLEDHPNSVFIRKSDLP